MTDVLSLIDFERSHSILSKLDSEAVAQEMRYQVTHKPKTHREYFLRWVFAFLSVHTTWQTNVRSFLAVKKLGSSFTKPQLKHALIKSRCGMYRSKATGIYEFYKKFKQDPTFWYKKEEETLKECRDRLLPHVYGLHLAKLSFALELCYPDSCDIACLDVHVLRLYGVADSKINVSDSVYRHIEEHLCDCCRKQGFASPIARNVYWNNVQGENSTKFWFHVLERNSPTPTPCRRSKRWIRKPKTARQPQDSISTGSPILMTR